MNTMLLKDEVQSLKQVPLFAGIPPAKLKLLAFTSDRVSYGAGEVLFRQGDVGDAAYVILSGSAEILAVHPRADKPAIRIVVRAVRGARGGLSLCPPLMLHEADGNRLSQRAEAIGNGLAPLFAD